MASGVELFWAERWMDMTKLTVAFHNFATLPKNGLTPQENSWEDRE
jgi:hypothetical protein